LGLQFSYGLHGVENCRTAGHVTFHLIHLVGRLDRYSTGIERDAFSHQSQVLFGFSVPITETNESGRIDTAASDLKESVETFPLQLLLIPNLEIQIAVFGDIPGCFSQ